MCGMCQWTALKGVAIWGHGGKESFFPAFGILFVRCRCLAPPVWAGRGQQRLWFSPPTLLLRVCWRVLVRAVPHPCLGVEPVRGGCIAATSFPGQFFLPALRGKLAQSLAPCEPSSLTWGAYFPKGPALAALSSGEDLAPRRSLLYSLGVLSFLLSVNPTSHGERCVGVCSLGVSF